MDHLLVRSIEHGLGWSGPGGLGAAFARGTLPDPGLTERLLVPERLLDAVMRRSLAPPQFRCFQNGTELHPDAYLTHALTRRAQVTPMVDMERLGQLLQDGCTAVLDALNTFDPTLEVACRALQWWSRERVQVNTYLTTGDATGFSLHWDDHDVVVVQLGGEKEWEVRGPSRRAPMYRDAERNEQPSEDVIWSGRLRRGEVMHIPRGYWHRATRSGLGEGYSLHVTFGFVKRTGVDWLTWAADRSREREVFRHDLDRWSGPVRERQGEHLAAEVADLLRNYSVDTYLRAREQEQVAARHVATRGLFGPVKSVLCVTQFPPQLVCSGSTVVVRAAGKEFTFAQRAMPVLRALVSGRPVDLDAFDEAAGAEIVAGVLIEEGVCAELTAALSSACTGLIPTGAS